MKTADPELMRAINRFHVLDAIRRAGSTSRTEICAATELSSTTVSAITASLLDDGLIVSRAIGGIRSPQRGRPRVMLEVNPDAARVLGVKLGPQRIVCAVTDFQGDVLAERATAVRVDRQPAAAIADLVEDLARRCLADAHLALGTIKSLCIALPGVTEHATGIVRYSPILGERDVALGEAIGARLGLPVLVESDSNAAAAAEHWFRACRGLDDFLLVAIGHSLGLAVMHGGQLFRGARGLSLHMGDLVVGGPQHPTRLADLAAEAAILSAFASEPEFAAATQAGTGLTLALRCRGAAGQRLDESIAQAAEALGIAIGNLVTLFAPPCVVLTGSSVAFGERLMQPLRAAMAATVPPWLRDVATLVVDDIDDVGWARGAAAVALRELYGAPWGMTGPVMPSLAARIDEAGG